MLRPISPTVGSPKTMLVQSSICLTLLWHWQFKSLPLNVIEFQ